MARKEIVIIYVILVLIVLEWYAHVLSASCAGWIPPLQDEGVLSYWEAYSVRIRYKNEKG